VAFMLWLGRAMVPSLHLSAASAPSPSEAALAAALQAYAGLWHNPALLFTLSDPCPACLGTGRVLSKTTTMARIERWLMRYRAEKGDRSLQLVVNPELAAYLSSGYRSQILRLSWKYWTRIKLIGDENVAMDEFRFLSKDGQEDLTNKYFS